MTNSSYTIQLPVYEGPLDLLLDLISKEELDITKVALAMVTDQYLAYMKSASKRELGDLTSFLVIAARLLQIKSEALLPRPPKREAGEEDPGEALALQLIAYKKYKEVADLLSRREKAGLRTFLRLSSPPKVITKLEMNGYQAGDLPEAYLAVLANQPIGPPIDQVVAPHRVRVRDRILMIVEAVRKKGRTTFNSLLSSAKTRLEIVVSFLALLELVKQHQIQVHQSEGFGDIEITPGEAWSEDQPLEFDLEFDE